MKTGETQTFEFNIAPEFFDLIIPSLAEKWALTHAHCLKIWRVLGQHGTKRAAIELTRILAANQKRKKKAA